MCKTTQHQKTCLLLAKKTICDVVGERGSLLIINFEQVIEPFLVLNIYFTFFLSVVACTFYKSTIKSNCILLSSHVRVRSSCLEENVCARALF